MARYRLPGSLGWMEHDAAADDDGFPEVGFDLPGLGRRLWLQRDDLTKVEPPKPRYRLPDKMGGHGVAIIAEKSVNGETWAHVVVDLGDESFPMDLPVTALADVPPPLPPEPPLLSVVRVGGRSNWIDLDGPPLREAARALWAAADAVERAKAGATTNV